ncbi:MAG: hypothetical protein D6732_09835 [Methanobacteriota archaeon]|nr:MAG: hypothetical protein D6732_09835 [Euryarchaeota archaeon]
MCQEERGFKGEGKPALMSRVLSHLLRDIASLTRYHEDASSRLCYFLGTREAIRLMLGVRDAAENQFLVLNVPPKEKSMEKVMEKVIKEIEIQGYDYEIRKDLGDVIAVKTKDRKKEFEQEIERAKESGEDISEVINKFDPEHIKRKGIPTVVVRRKASIEASMGASIVSGDIIQSGNIQAHQEVAIQNMYYDVVAHGIAELSSEEIKRSPGRIAIRTLEGRYDVFTVHHQKRYRNGLYSVTTLPRILGMNVLKFKKNKSAYILVIAQDNGEVAVELKKRAPEGSKVAIFIHNESHKKAVVETIERLRLEPEEFKFIEDPIDKYAKSRPRKKFTHFFIEFPSSEIGRRPNPFVNLEEKNFVNFARYQFQAIRALTLIGENEAQIAYVSHSFDPSENEDILVQTFRQGYFSPLVLTDDLREAYPVRMNAIPEIPTISQGGSIDLNKMRAEESYSSCWLRVDPFKHGADAGFVAYFELLLKGGGRRR